MRPLGLQVTTSEAGRALFEPMPAHQKDRIPRTSQLNETSSFLSTVFSRSAVFLKCALTLGQGAKPRLSLSRPYSSDLENVTQTFHQTKLSIRTSSLSSIPAQRVARTLGT